MDEKEYRERIELIQEIARITITETLEDMQRRGKLPCVHNCFGLRQEHKEQHNELEEIIRMLKRVEDIKWSVLKAVLIGLAFGLLAYFGLKLQMP